MTDQTTGKVAKLNPEEWKQLVVLNAVQLQNYLQSIPGTLEGGASGLTGQHQAAIDEHVARGRTFMRAWSLATLDMPTQPKQAAQPKVPQTNGAAAPKKGGWPKGRKRTPKQPAAQQ